jgi:hypothetical protein
VRLPLTSSSCRTVPTFHRECEPPAKPEMSFHLFFRTLCSSFFSSLSMAEGVPIFLAFNFTVVRGLLTQRKPEPRRLRIISGPSNAQHLLASRFCTHGLIARSLKHIQSVLGSLFLTLFVRMHPFMIAARLGQLDHPHRRRERPFDKICTSARLVPRPADGSSRQARPRPAAIAFHLEPAQAAAEALPDHG